MRWVVFLLVAGFSLRAAAGFACEVPASQLPSIVVPTADVVVIGRVVGARAAGSDQNLRLAKGLEKKGPTPELVLLDIEVDEALKGRAPGRMAIGYWSSQWKPAGLVEWLRGRSLIALWDTDKPAPLQAGDPQYFAARPPFLSECGRTSFFYLDSLTAQRLRLTNDHCSRI